jgi:hypothetical protein
MGMQDKYNIGPVTIVQLVGLSAKPKIASVQTDAAARAADPVPMSAAAGFGDDMSQPLADVVPSFQSVKVMPALGLSADPVRSHISLEAGVDRPVVDANAPVSTIDPSTFDKAPLDGNLPDPSIGPRGEAILPDDAPSYAPDAMSGDPADADIAAIAIGAVFDGIETFGDDHILDFSTVIEVGEATLDATTLAQANTEVAIALAFSGIVDWGDFAIIDCAGGISPEPQLMNDDFVAPVHQLSATDAIPVL